MPKALVYPFHSAMFMFTNTSSDNRIHSISSDNTLWQTPEKLDPYSVYLARGSDKACDNSNLILDHLKWLESQVLFVVLLVVFAMATGGYAQEKKWSDEVELSFVDTGGKRNAG